MSQILSLLPLLAKYPLEGCMFLTLVALSTVDLALTIYPLHRWPGHAVESGFGTVEVIRLMAGAFPFARATIVQDMSLLLWAVSFYGPMYFLLQWLHGPVGVGFWAAAIFWRARTVFRNASLVATLRVKYP